ncbi:hypothetical protein Hanom_Chr16g01431311 [Helianthus anomalus]
MVPIVTQGGWNVMSEIIIPAEWNAMPPEPPLNILHGVPVAVAPPPQDNDLAFFLPREIEESMTFEGYPPVSSSKKPLSAGNPFPSFYHSYNVQHLG